MTSVEDVIVPGIKAWHDSTCRLDNGLFEEGTLLPLVLPLVGKLGFVEDDIGRVRLVRKILPLTWVKSPVHVGYK